MLLPVASPTRPVWLMRLSSNILRSKASVQGPVLKTQGVPIIPAWLNLLSKKQIQQPLIFKDDGEQPLRQPNASFCITRLLQRQADGWSRLHAPALEAAQLCVKLEKHRAVHMASGRRDPKFSCAAAGRDQPAHTQIQETLVWLQPSQKASPRNGTPGH